MRNVKIIEEEIISVDEIKKLINASDVAAMRAAILIYEHGQTEEEKRNRNSTELNGKGFNRLDTGPLTEFARDCIRLRGNKRSEIDKVRYRLVKYAGQIHTIIQKSNDVQMKWKV